MRYPQSNQLSEIPSVGGEIDWDNPITPPANVIPTNLSKDVWVDGQTWIAPKSGIMRLAWTQRINSKIIGIAVAINGEWFYHAVHTEEGHAHAIPATKGDRVAVRLISTIAQTLNNGAVVFSLIPFKG